MYRTELPSHGIPSFISDLTSSPSSSVCGRSVRVIGRVEKYDASSNQAILSEPHDSSSKLLVDASLTDAENFKSGLMVMLIGEVDAAEEYLDMGVKKSEPDKVCKDLKDRVKKNLHDNEIGNYTAPLDFSIFLKARVAQCVDRLDYSLYRQAVKVWRELDQADFNQDGP